MASEASPDPHPTGWPRWPYSTNHKDIGTLHLGLSVVAGLCGAVLSWVIRLGVAQPGVHCIDASHALTATVTADAGSYTVTGNAAELLAAHVMAAVTGTYTITGNAATLTVAEVAAAIDLIGPLLSALQDPARISALVDPARLSALLNPARVSDVEPN